jgi:hypothetical protein
MNVRSLSSRSRALLLAVGIVAGLVLLYGLAGAVLLPWVVKRELPALAAEKWNAQARVTDVGFNPFTLRLRASGFSLEEKSGKPLLALREAIVDFEWRSLARRGLVLSELKVSEPVLRVEISEKGQLNFATLLGAPGGRQTESTPPAVDLGSVTIENGRIDFEDKAQGYANRFERLSLSLSSVSTTKGDKGPYDLVAQTPDGGKLRWKGEVSITPPALTGTLVLEEGMLAQLNPYLRGHFDGHIASGRVRLELPHRFALETGKPQIEVKGATLAVRDFALVARGAGQPQVKLKGATLAVERVVLAVQGGGEPQQVEVSGAALMLEDLALAAQGTEAPYATLARLAVAGVDVDQRERRLRVKSLRAAGYNLVSRRDAAGVLHPSRLLPALRGDAREAAWQFVVGEVDLSGGSVSLADEGTGITLALEKVAAKVAELTSDTGRPLAFDVTADLAGGGRIAARGKAVPASAALEGRIEASAVPVALFQALLARHANVKIKSGVLAFAGDLSTGGETKTRRGKSAKLVYSGTAALENVSVQDGAGAPLVEWKSLHTKSLQLAVAPNMARIDDLRWTAPKARLEIEAGGKTNLGGLFSGEGDAAAPAATGGRKPAESEQKPAPAPRDESPEPAVGAESERPDEAGGFPIRVRRVQVEKGTLDFSDRTLSPNFRALIQDLAGTVNGLSTDRNTRSQLALEGRVDEHGYARVSGTLNAFAPRERTNVRLQFRNIELAGVSPYTIKFAGYRVATGRLTLDLNYRVRDNRLEGDNHVVLDNFTLGERVGEGASPGLPLETAVSLLKDENGRIDLAIPISGSLDDPDFKLGDVFWKALGTILGNIVAAPFRALARLFGGGSEQLASIAFEPGESRLLPPEREKFARIAEGLAKRPDLKVVIPARYDAGADSRALKREALRRELGKRAGFELAEEDAAAPISLEDRRTRRAMRELYAQRFGDQELSRLKAEAEREAGSVKPRDLTVADKIRNFAAGEPQVADPSAFYRALYRGLLEGEALPEGALPGLAQKRSAAIAAALQTAGVGAERMTLSSAEPSSNADAKQVTIQLTLAPAG